MCSPRPVSASRLADRGTGTAGLGSATAHITQGPGVVQAQPDQRTTGTVARPASRRACRSALVSISDTTTAMSSQRPVTPHRCKVATVNSRARWTGPASVPGARAGSPAGRPSPPARYPATAARCRWPRRPWPRPVLRVPGSSGPHQGSPGAGGLATRVAAVWPGGAGPPSMRRPGRPSALARWPGRPSPWPWHGPTARPGGWRGTRPWSAGTAGRPAARERRSAIRPGWPGPGRRPRRARCDQRARKCRNPFRTT